MANPMASREAYLDALRELLPAGEASRVAVEVDALIRDRIAAEVEDGATEAEAEEHALAAFGPPASLAAALGASPMTIDLGTRRAFTRFFAVTAAAHLLLSIIMTVAGGGEAAIPGVLAPLPTSPLAALLANVVAILLMDLGAIGVLFFVFGRGTTPSWLPRLELRRSVSKRNAIMALIMLGLLWLVLGPLRDQIFAVHEDGRLVPFLAPPIVALVPWANFVIVAFALSAIVVLVRGGEDPLGTLLDGFASLGLAAVLVVAATSGELVDFPEKALGSRGARVLEDLTTRVFMLLFIVAALMLTVRAVKRFFRFRQLLSAG